MPRYLYLLRHAHTAEKHPGQNDLERTLSSTGVKQALLIGRYLHQQQTPLDSILCSTADRAHATAGLIADALKVDTDKVIPQEELYEASTRTFFAFVAGLEDDQHHVMCVGHNPTISYLAEFLTGSEIGDMVPAGLAVIRFNLLSWRDISQGNGSLENYLTPEMVDTFQ
ncbi:SixA phosphatase family protein [Dawidia soli]|uniref:Histidine phosphatase family protein n=1 Tax=Dawidia soli TaxID=2782352 RepID=A0AAP2DBT2_9BACT|nr:histidine phosphatase family protein [Dawidia soli]MBT1688532.1 histidine phosphatase family protein [Dawidia soli]